MGTDLSAVSGQIFQLWFLYPHDFGTAMKLHPVFTAGTVASLIAAPSLTPAYANAAENILYFRVTVGAESEPTADTEESDSPETEVAEEQHADEEVPEEIEAPEPADEVETTPDVLEAEVETPEIIEGEPRSEPEVRVQDDAADQATQASTIEPLEIYSAVPTEADPLGTLEASSVDSVVQAAAPRSQALLPTRPSH